MASSFDHRFARRAVFNLSRFRKILLAVESKTPSGCKSSIQARPNGRREPPERSFADADERAKSSRQRSYIHGKSAVMTSLG
jgi:hypothetical protein